jgi:hypothetical protein
MKRIVVHIDRLVLRGFGQDERDSVAKGLRAELGRLLAAPETLRQLGAQDGVSRLKIGPVRVGQGTKSTAIGAQTAQGIAQGIQS